jgi:hypothetical protein
MLKGSGLGALLTDVAAHRLPALAEPLSLDRVLGRGVPSVREMVVRKAARGKTHEKAMRNGKSERSGGKS